MPTSPTGNLAASLTEPTEAPVENGDPVITTIACIWTTAAALGTAGWSTAAHIVKTRGVRIAR